MKPKILVFVLAFATCGLYAQNASSLLIESRPKDIATANMQAAAASLVFAENNLGVEANYGLWSPNIINNQLLGLNSYFKFSDKFAIGLKGLYLTDKDQGIGSTGTGAIITKDKIEGADMIIELAGSFKALDFLSFGLNAKFFSSVLTSELKASAFAADLSAAFCNGPLAASLSLNNLGTALKFGNSSSPLPSSLSIAASYLVLDALRANVQLSYFFAGSFMLGAGAEYSLKDIVFVRAAYNYGSGVCALPSFASLGLGFKFVGIELNASYLLASQTLSNTLLFGLGYSF